MYCYVIGCRPKAILEIECRAIKKVREEWVWPSSS